MTAVIQKWGNSQGIRLPKIFLEDLNINESDKVEMFVQDNSIVIKKSMPERKTIEELFNGYSGDFILEEIDWGEPVGGEVW